MNVRNVCAKYLGILCAGGMLLAANSQASVDLSSWETILPHASEAPVANYERQLLTQYLNNPTQGKHAENLAVDHITKMLIYSVKPQSQYLALRHAILAQYFLQRTKTLKGNSFWLQLGIAKTQQEINRVINKNDALSTAENLPAQAYFNNAFNYQEANRYQAETELLKAFVQAPHNVYTSFLLDAVFLWNGGEAGYDDPTALYSFVLGSYFSVHTINLAKAAEERWQQQPQAYSRFRMASILGGFSALHRRWLAKLHQDEEAVALIDNEHRQWRLIHRSFHAFTVGLAFFEEPENFLEGLFAWGDALAHCQEVPVRTCSDTPRFSHNFFGFLLGYADYLLKVGDVNAAQQILSLRFNPQLPVQNFAFWDLGREHWIHRENNAAAISALYLNDDPSDDPLNYLMTKRKWGGNTSTCQNCHQAQSKYWSPEEQAVVMLPPEPVATVGTWPAFATTWYGSKP